MAENNLNIAVFLANSDHPHQQHLKIAAEKAAARLGASVAVQFAGVGATATTLAQMQQVFEAVSGERGKVDAVLVHPVSGTGNEQIVEKLAERGVPCLIVNRTAEGLDKLRLRFPRLPFCCVTPDQVEVGRMQARQFQRLHEGEGLVLYVQGLLVATAAQQRLAGMREVLRSSKLKDRCLFGDWLTAKAASAVENWFASNPAGSPLPNVIGCQNDAMAMGAREALDRVAAKRREPAIGRIPITGCDGAADYGARFVREGKLAATIELPDPIEPAFGVLERFFRRGEMPPVLVALEVRSVPDLTKLKPVTANRQGAHVA